MSILLFLKFGGSLITDKTRPYTPHLDRIHRLAEEVQQALEERSDLRLLLGHGSGSFGHQAAASYDTRHGVRTPQQWQGFAEVAAAAARLNRIVTDVFRQAGVPLISFQPSASARCRAGALVHMDTAPISEALSNGLVPLIYGDVALDEERGGVIVSTEDLFVYLARRLRPQRILLVGESPGVLDDQGKVIPQITPSLLASIRPLLSGSHGVDVTGGMADKVNRMVALVERQPGLDIRIFSGLTPGHVHQVLLDPGVLTGTRVQVSGF